MVSSVASISLNDQAQNDSATLNALSALDAAVAIIDTKTDTYIFVSTGFKQIINTAVKHSQWPLSITTDKNLHDVIQAGLLSDAMRHVAVCVIEDNSYAVEFKKLPDSQKLITFNENHKMIENLHEYMQVRDSLFSTSRTISVSEMATTLAHEINTPIGTITNILRGIKLRLAKPDASLDKIDDALSRALEQTQFTQSVINRIRDFTQSRRPQHSVLDLRPQIAEAVSLLDWMLSQSYCEVQIQLPDEPIYIVGDATMLQQVLINLLRNAVDAMESQSTTNRIISIQIESSSSTATVSISDTGEGLGDGSDTLFVPFATSKASGMGVGLNICRSFVELHQGRLWLSPNDEEGCTSYMELPLANELTVDEHQVHTGDTLHG